MATWGQAEGPHKDLPILLPGRPQPWFALEAPSAVVPVMESRPPAITPLLLDDPTAMYIDKY